MSTRSPLEQQREYDSEAKTHQPAVAFPTTQTSMLHVDAHPICDFHRPVRPLRRPFHSKYQQSHVQVR